MKIILWDCLTVLTLLSSIYGNYGFQTNYQEFVPTNYRMDEQIPLRARDLPLERYARAINLDVGNVAKNGIHREQDLPKPANPRLKQMEYGRTEYFGTATPMKPSYAKDKQKQAWKEHIAHSKHSPPQIDDRILLNNEMFEKKGLVPNFLHMLAGIETDGGTDANVRGFRDGYIVIDSFIKNGNSEVPGVGHGDELIRRWIVGKFGGRLAGISIATGERAYGFNLGSYEFEKEKNREKRSIIMRGGITGKDYWDKKEAEKAASEKESKEKGKSFYERNKASTENTAEGSGQLGSHVGWDVILGATGGALGGATGGGIGAGLGGIAGGPGGAAGAAAAGAVGSGIGGAIGGGLGSAIGGGIGEMLGGDTAVTIMTGLVGGLGGAIGSGIGGGIGGAIGGGAGGAANGLGVMGIPGAIGGGIGGVIGGVLGGGAGAGIGGAIGTQFDGGIGGEVGNSAKGEVTASIGGRRRDGEDLGGLESRMGDGVEEESVNAEPQDMDCINILVIPVDGLRKKRCTGGRGQAEDKVVSLIVGYRKSI